MNNLNKSVNIFLKYYTKEQFDNVIKHWSEEHRYYHNMSHLNDVLYLIEKLVTDEPDLLNSIEIDILVISAFFHDIVYSPLKDDNEDISIKMFKSMSSDLPFMIKKGVIYIINSTKSREYPTWKLPSIFWEIDNSIFIKSSYNDLIEYENKIFKEFQFVDYIDYKEKRIEFLKSNLTVFTNKDIGDKIEFLINYIENRKPRIGVYAGSFNPFTTGHLNIINKSKKLFDKVIVAYGQNPEKSTQEVDVPVTLQYMQVDQFNGLITDYITSLEDKGLDVTIVRGLRNGADLDYEINQLRFIKDIKPDVKFIYLTCDKEFEHISSSAVRSLVKVDPKSAKKYIVK